MPRKPRKPAGRPKGARNKRLNPRVLRAIELIAHGDPVTGNHLSKTEAASIVGMRRESLSRALQRENYVARVLERARAVAGPEAALEAALTLRELQANAKSEYVKAEIALKVLAINGIKPREQGAAAGGGVTVNLILKHVQRPAEPISGTSAQLIDGTTGQAIEPAR